MKKERLVFNRTGLMTLLMILATLSVAAFIAPASAEAATWKTGAYGNGYSVSFSSGKVWYAGSSIYSSCSGDTVRLAEDVSRAGFVTDGKTVYYAVGKRVRNVKVDGSGRKNIVKVKSSAEVYARTGKYLYYGNRWDDIVGFSQVRVLNITTGKNRAVYKYGGGGLTARNGYVVVLRNASDVSNQPLFLFKADGSGKRKIGVAHESMTGSVGIRGKRVYYSKVSVSRMSGAKAKCYRVFSYDIKTKKTKAVSSWITSSTLEKKFSKYFD